MKIRIIQNLNLTEFERQVNVFNDEHNVKATQTHVTAQMKIDNNYETLVYTAVVYYE